jgi:flagellar biosynthesis protein FliQ
MNEALFLDLLKQTLWMTALIASPMLVTGLLVGTFVSLIQTVTQLQEQTLTFVPKLLISGMVLVVMAPWMLQQLTDHGQRMFQLMIELAKSSGNA